MLKTINEKEFLNISL